MKIAFIGLGMMGHPMAERLIRQGHATRVFDANAGLSSGFGPAFASSPAEAVAGADIIITMLPTGQIVRDVLVGHGGALTGVPAGKIVIDTSSSDAGGTVALGRELAERGIHLIDAPVSGGVPLAREGKLTLMVGGADDELFATIEPVLKVLGSKVVRVGGLGSGHAAKAINMAIAACTLAATCEGLLLGERFGLDPAVLLDVINSSTGGSTVSQTVVKNHIVPKTFAQGFALALMTKDVRLANALGEQQNLCLPLLEKACENWGAALDALPHGADFSAYFQFAKANLESSK